MKNGAEGMKTHQAELTEEQLIIFNMFFQDCYHLGIERYFHRYINSYQHAQDYLIEKGIIKEEECCLDVDEVQGLRDKTITK